MITWVSFDQSTSKFAGGYVISQHKWGLILGSIGVWNPCQLPKIRSLRHVIMHLSCKNLVSRHRYVSCFSSPDDTFEAVVTFPTYQSLYEDLRTFGVTVKYWSADYTSQGWTFDISKLKSQLTEKTKLLVVNFPNNPTGFVPSPQVM